MSNYTTGHSAEKQAAEYLESLGFKIREINWKTKYCEIDIVAEKSARRSRFRRAEPTIYFVEVKSRRNTNQGHGLDYITPKKLNQMRFAAEMWVSNHDWKGDYQLAAIGIDGGQITFVDEI